MLWLSIQKQGSNGQSCVLCAAARGWRCRRESDYAMRARTRTLTTSHASQRHGTLKRSSSSIADPQHINDASTACSSPFLFLSVSSFLGSRSIVFEYSRVLSPSAVLYYCCHSSFVHLLCSFIYTHSLGFISFLIYHIGHVEQLPNSPHARLPSLIPSLCLFIIHCTLT
jgi:hypothetical protein